MSKQTQLILGLNAEVLDKTNGFIVTTNQYDNMIQVIAPFDASDSVSLNFYLRNARIENYTQYIKVLKDSEGNLLTGKDVVNESNQYYQTASDWYVWQGPISAKALRAISKYHAGTVDLTITFRSFRNQAIEDTGTYLGTFGSSKSTTSGDLPASATEGDFYKCDMLDYYSYNGALDFTLLDLAIWTNNKWTRGDSYEDRVNSPSTEIGVDASIFGQPVSEVDPTTSEYLLGRMSTLESVILGAEPSSTLDDLYVKTSTHLAYPEITTVNTNDVLYIERSGISNHITLDNLTLGLNEVESSILRTPSALSGISGSGFYADDTNILIGSATGNGISWDGTNLYIRGTLTAAEITDPVLLEQLTGADGNDGNDGYTPIFGVDYFNGADGADGKDGQSFNFKGTVTAIADLYLISNPAQNDAYRVTDTGELWVYNGSTWDNMGTIQGEPAKYVVVSGERSFKYEEGETIPTNTSITLSASLFGGLTVYEWQYWNGASWETLSNTSNTILYTLNHNDPEWGSSSVLRIRCRSGSDEYTDEYTMVKLYDGKDAIIGYLTNETVSIQSSADGTSYSLTGVSGSFEVFEGITDVTGLCTFGGTLTKNGLTLTIDASGVYTLTGGSWTSDFESFSLTASFNGSIITKIFTISKAKQGNQGPQGTDPDYVIINGEQAFIFEADQTVPDNTFITLTASLFGSLTSYDWEYHNGSQWTNLTTGTQNTSTYTINYNDAEFSGNTIRIRCLSSDKFDEITLVKLYDGATGIDAVSGYLTNEVEVVSADQDGQNYILTGKGGMFKLYDGIIDKTSETSFTVTTATKNGLTLAIGASTGVYSVSGTWTSDVESFELNATYNGITISKIFSIYKSRQGLSGSDPKYVVISGPIFFKFLKDQTIPTYNSIVLNAQLFGNLTTYDWEYWNGSIWTDFTTTQTLPTFTLTYNNAAWGSNTELRVRCLSGTIYDEQTIVKLYDGTTGDTGGDGPPGADGTDGTSVVLKGSVPTVGDLPAGATTGDLYVVLADGDGYVYNGATWDNVGQIQGPTGASGTSYYVWYAYANSANGQTDFSRTYVGNEEYVGVYTGTESDETNLTYIDYDWSKFLGNDGEASITAQLSNDSAVVVSAYDGTGYVLTGTSGTLYVYNGTTDVTTSSTFAVTTATKNGLTASIDSSGTYTFSGASWTSDSESFEFTGTYNGTTLSKIFTIAKAKQGDQGLQGASPDYVKITGEGTFKYLEGATDPTSTTITLSAELYGALTTYDWEYWTGAAWANLSGTQTSSTYSLTHNQTEWSTNTSLRVRCLSGEFFDEMTILKLYDGTNGTNGINGKNAISGRLEDPYYTTPAANDGTGYSLSSAGGTFFIYSGTNDVTTSSTFSLPNGILDGTSTFYTETKNGLTLTLYKNTGIYSLAGASWTTDSETFQLSASYDGATINTIYRVVKSKQGDAGTAATYVTITGPQTFIYPAGATIPNDTILTLHAELAGGLSSYSWQYLDPSNSTWTNLSGAEQTLQEYNLAYNNIAWSIGVNDYQSLRIRCTSGLKYDEYTVVKIYDGSDGYTPIKGVDYDDGENGLPGLPGTDGKDTYVHYVYADDILGATNFSTSWDNDQTYVGTMSDFNVADSTNPDLYEWSRFIGPKSVTGLLSNENDSLVTDSLGTATSITGIGGTFTIREGITIVNAETACTFSITGGTDAGTTWTKNQNGLVMTINEATGDYTLSINTSWTTDSETFDLVGTYIGDDGTVSITKSFTLTKQIAGANGNNGIAGPGLVFQGEFSDSISYISDINRRDVVLYNSSYYALKQISSPAIGAWVSSEWEIMSNFNSVATDILLADDATVLKGLTIGESGQTAGGSFIRSYGMGSLTSGSGFYLRNDGQVRLGNTSGNNMYWNNSTLAIQGDITGSSGTFGDVVIDNTGITSFDEAQLISYEDFEDNSLGNNWVASTTVSTNPANGTFGIRSTTASTGTGPSSAYEGSKFFYIEASGGTFNYDENILNTFSGISTEDYVLEFYYHANGVDCEALTVSSGVAEAGTGLAQSSIIVQTPTLGHAYIANDTGVLFVANGSTWVNRGLYTGQEEYKRYLRVGDVTEWTKVSYVIPAGNGRVRIRFETGAGFLGDISIDKLMIRPKDYSYFILKDKFDLAGPVALSEGTIGDFTIKNGRLYGDIGNNLQQIIMTPFELESRSDDMWSHIRGGGFSWGPIEDGNRIGYGAIYHSSYFDETRIDLPETTISVNDHNTQYVDTNGSLTLDGKINIKGKRVWGTTFSAPSWSATTITRYGGACATRVSTTHIKVEISITFNLDSDPGNGGQVCDFSSTYSPDVTTWGFLGNNPGTDFSTAVAPYYRIDTDGTIHIDETTTSEDPVTIQAVFFKAVAE